MGALALLGLLGVVVSIPFFEDDDGPVARDDDTAEGAPDEDLPPAEPDTEVDGAVLAFDGTEAVTGTEGDDTLIAGISSEDLLPMITTVDLAGGDDVATITGGESFDIRGGVGDDSIVIEGFGVNHSIHGDDGNDTLVAGEGNFLLGGAGDDVLTINLSTTIFDSFTQSDAGAGDDTITVTSFVGDAVPDFSSVGVTGGEGNDAFTAELTVIEDQFNGPDSTATSIRSFSGVVFNGFDTEEDTLVIEIDRAEGQQDRILASTDLLPLSSEGDYQVQLTFSATNDDPEMTTYITLRDVEGPLTIDDIDIVDLVTAA
ncbi:calcium-binding protein [uncultured Tateyamaria sp.]|uniref:calcium-binding protein n=1 Tax=uncultured Tateyamaria sp. TaxID=455651 RepID=UPI002622A756|nr:hypothetical protein [uncultured Tateyamaria sp.]